MLAQTRGIVLKTQRYGEADLIVTVLTNSGNRLQLFGRSALKSKKRFGGGILEPTRYIQVSYEDRRSRLGGESDLHSLREASMIEDFEGLRSDYSRLEVALSLLNTVHQIVRNGDFGSAEIFNLLGNALKAAEVSTDLAKLKTHFEVRLLASQGVLELDGDASRLMHLPIDHHASEDLASLDWRQVGRVAGLQLKQYIEMGAVD